MNMINASITGGASFINPHIVDPSNGEILWYGTTDGPWRTTNASSAKSTADVNWIDAGVPFTSPPSSWAVVPNDSNKVYVGAGSSLYRNFSALSANAGTTWTRVDGNGLEVGERSWLEVDANDPTGNTVYVTSSTMGAFVSPHVNRTTDAGDTWTDITSDLPEIPFHSIVVQPGVSEHLYVGSELGVFMSRDTGASWVHMDTPGFANTVVEALEFQDDNTLYAFTHGRGAFRAIISPDEGAMTVSPVNPVEISGPEGGAFSPSSQTYTIRNTGATTFNWSALDNVGWLSVSPTFGTLTPGAWTTVDVTVSAGANALSTGPHAGLMTFTDVNAGVSIEREIHISVTGTPQTIQSFNLSSNPGWSTEGDWAYGVPQGLGSFSGDPTSGKTGSNVYGYNLSGDYANDLPERSLTTTAVDCSGYVGVSLSFWRWLSVEDLSRDRVRIQVSNDASVWHEIWRNTQVTTDDGQWLEQTFDISAIADNRPTVYIRWSLGPTDYDRTRPGWNIDDVTVSGTPPADEIWVDFAHSGLELGTPTQPFNTLTDAVAALTGDGTETVKMKAYTGDPDSAESITINKNATFESVNGTVRVGAVP